MNSEHLGDAFDHWKGSIIQRLESAKLLRDIAVIPMFTDNKWDSQKVSAYSRLLNLDICRVLQSNKVFGGDKHHRKKYFEEVTHSGDLFLDPDIGVKIKQKTNHKLINVCEIEKLINNDRVLLVYQHGGGKKLSEKVTETINEVQRQIQDLNVVTYECGTVAMLFFSRDRNRVDKIRDHLVEMLADDPQNRVKKWYR